ncbi:MAG: 6-bladed beta-propeller [Gemmatimonadetes bacterium]|nr:6-bladed beta-propeller [Gemmatimonadota bacterium]
MLLQVACEAGVPPKVVVTDSAGIHLTISADEPKHFAQLDSVPTISLGGPDASGPQQFFRVQGVYLDEAGRLWVADGQSGELRIFQPDGTHWKTIGGRGEGPGEFLQIRLLGATAGDSVLCGDSGADRITVYDPEGDFVRTDRLPSSERPPPRPFDVFPDGSVLGQQRRVLMAQSLEPGQILRDSVELVRVRLDAQTEEPYGLAAGPLWLWTGGNQVPVPFTTNASFDVVGDEVHLVSGPDFRVRVFNGGGFRAVYGVEREPRIVSASDLDSYRGFVEEYLPESMRPEYLEPLDNEERPSRLPGYDRVIASSDGYLWAQVYESDLAAPHDWDVFDRKGLFRGRVHVWSGFHPFVITGDVMAGVWRDPIGVEFVHLYRLLR